MLADSLFSIDTNIRYLALYHKGELSIHCREDLKNASSPASDQYEELLVNPTLLTLVKQRGDIDCGGSEFVLVGYGNFYQLIIPLLGGHISVAFEKTSNPLLFLNEIRTTCLDALDINRT